MRRWLRYLGGLAAAIVAHNVLAWFIFAFPMWAFPYQAGTDRLRFHAATPLPDVTAEIAARIMRELDTGPLPPGAGPYHVYVTGSGWRERLFFAGAPGAGGVVYALASKRNVFLSGADLGQNRLLKGEVTIPPPRTLSYYVKHELTHLAQLERLGVRAYYSMPRVLREGTADIVALGPAGPELREAVTAHRGNDLLPLMQAFGAYPEFRVEATDALEGTSMEALIMGGDG